MRFLTICNLLKLAVLPYWHWCCLTNGYTSPVPSSSPFSLSPPPPPHPFSLSSLFFCSSILHLSSFTPLPFFLPIFLPFLPEILFNFLMHFRWPATYVNKEWLLSGMRLCRLLTQCGWVCSASTSLHFCNIMCVCGFVFFNQGFVVLFVFSSFQLNSQTVTDCFLLVLCIWDD